MQNPHVIAAMSKGEEVLEREQRSVNQRKSETFEKDNPIYKEPVPILYEKIFYIYLRLKDNIHLPKSRKWKKS